MVSGVSPQTGSREAKVAVLPTVAQCAAAKRPATEYASSVPTTPKSAVEIVIPVALDDATPIVPVSAVVQAADTQKGSGSNCNPELKSSLERKNGDDYFSQSAEHRPTRIISSAAVERLS
jgi:hypothetical protein